MLSSYLSFVSCVCVFLAVSGFSSYNKATDNSDKHHHRIQHGPCSYTFLLPEIENCQPTTDYHLSNSLQGDAPPVVEPNWSLKRLQQLEGILENNTQWLQKLENYIQDSVKTEIVEIQRNAVQNQTAAMLEIGTNLLTQTAEQTRKLTDVETQVLNQTSRLEIQLLENSLSTNKLEKQIMVQTQEITKLHEKNSFLEQKVLEMEGKHETELQSIKAEKLEMQDLLVKQSTIIGELEKQLNVATQNNSVLQSQQLLLMETVHNLLNMVSHGDEIKQIAKDQVTFKDCAEVYKSGFTTSGVYTLHIINATETVRVFCDMEINGGGWTIFQHRENGNIDFHRDWKEYKLGFGDASGEYWLGNEFVHLLTSQSPHVLRIQLKDWNGNEAFATFDHFLVGSEEEKYQLHIKGYSGTAGRTSSLSPSGTKFSTKDADNDECGCKCSQMASGGWWFQACGPSNLNGMYYSGGMNTIRFNGIKWHYWKGSHYSLKSTTMMFRPVGF
ncbi:angiopoietin-2b [Stegostoma tigrinum]|uniref:angiopoietin-2b n=1 Tax=Stegostoma tigrinum TaxID=3053191 RepID=UPI00202B94A1|nr:angiopoietin-2b [Stegostoma tigrinum]XP_048414382.1 angiopoietin-2b [Stegostoma tigrinum]